MIGHRGPAALALAALATCGSPAPQTARDAGAGSALAQDAPPPDASQPAPRPGSPPVIVIDEPRLAQPTQESFRLVSPGRAPRIALRYRFATGATAIAARTTLRSRRLEHGAFSAPVELPAIRDGFALAAGTEHPGQIALRGLTGEAAAASPDADAYLAPWRALLQDRRAELELDDRGGIRAIRFLDDPSGARSEPARDELAQRLLWLIVPVPAEPVGLGASWRVVTILRQGSAIAKQTATYTLLARGAAGWRLHVKLQRVGEQQRIADPSLPPGTLAELIALFRALEGDVEVAPELPLIAGGALAIESRLHARLQRPGGAPVDQAFEDTGRVSFARCRRPSPGAAPPRSRAGTLAACPDDFAPP